MISGEIINLSIKSIEKILTVPGWTKQLKGLKSFASALISEGFKPLESVLISEGFKPLESVLISEGFKPLESVLV